MHNITATVAFKGSLLLFWLVVVLLLLLFLTLLLCLMPLLRLVLFCTFTSIRPTSEQAVPTSLFCFVSLSEQRITVAIVTLDRRFTLLVLLHCFFTRQVVVPTKCMKPLYVLCGTIRHFQKFSEIEFARQVMVVLSRHFPSIYLVPVD